MFSEFVVNFSILFCFTILIFWLFIQYGDRPFINNYKSVIAGLTFGIVALILTLLTAPFANGILINSRTIFLIFGGLVGGPITILIVGIIVCLSRGVLFFTSTLSYIMMYNILFLTVATAFAAYKRPITYQNLPIYFFALTFEHIIVLLIYYRCSLEGIQYLTMYLIFTTGSFYVIRKILLQLEDKNMQIKQIYTLGQMDFLTQLPNNIAIEKKLLSYIHAKTPFELLHIDIRDFQNINYTFHYEVGDEILVQVGELIQRKIPEDAFIGRVGSDEFYIILPNAVPATAIHFAAELERTLRNTTFQKNELIQLSLAIGISSCPANTYQLNQLYKNTYLSLKHAKTKDEIAICHYNQLK